MFNKREESLEDEIQDYLDRETAENIAAGMSPQEARLAARRKLGPPLRIKEDTRLSWGWTWLERLWQDLRHGWRILKKTPGFTLIAVLSIALGVGANCAMFSAADAMLLRPLPVARPGELMTVGAMESLNSYVINIRASYPDFADLRKQNRSFSGLVAWSIVTAGIARQSDALPHVKMGAAVSGDFFDVLGVQPALGRAFRPEEDQVPGRDAVVVISHDLWAQDFSSDPAIVGRRIRLNGTDFTVVGVAPDGFTGVAGFFRSAFYMPLMMLPREGDPRVLDRRAQRFLNLKGRLKPGVTEAQAQAEVAAFAANLERAYPDTNRNLRWVVRSELQARIAQDPPDAMLFGMLFALSLAVLFVACANVAGLLTSRAPARTREISVRLAIGAGRWRLIRQMLTESVLLALAGGVLGLAVAQSGIQLLITQIQPPSDLIAFPSIGLDARALWFALGISIFSVAVFGLAPAIHTTRTDLTYALKSSDSAVPGKRRLLPSMSGRNVLVAAQVAVTLVLLTLAAFMYRGFHRLMEEGPGYRTDHIAMMSFNPSLIHYTPEQTRNFYDQLVKRVQATPGVKSAALATMVPMNMNLDGAVIVPEGHVFPQGIDSAQLFANRVDENFFETMAVPIVRGRGFLATDDSGALRVAVINQTLAEHYWPGQDPIGKRFRLHDRNGPWVEIVGVAKDGKYVTIMEAPTEFVYLPLKQNPQPERILLAQSAGDSAGLMSSLREVVRTLDSNQPIFDARTMEQLYGVRANRTMQVIVELVGGMGVMGLLLALVGLYGLVSYSARRRTKEIGIRMAIGASPASVRSLVLRQGAVLAACGLAVGMVLSAVAGRFLSSAFPNRAGFDFLSYLLVVAALLAVTLAAAYIPARRAARLDPVRALRYE